jgi:hypothetical protein
VDVWMVSLLLDHRIVVQTFAMHACWTFARCSNGLLLTDVLTNSIRFVRLFFSSQRSLLLMRHPVSEKSHFSCATQQHQKLMCSLLTTHVQTWRARAQIVRHCPITSPPPPCRRHRHTERRLYAQYTVDTHSVSVSSLDLRVWFQNICSA